MCYDYSWMSSLISFTKRWVFLTDFIHLLIVLWYFYPTFSDWSATSQIARKSMCNTICDVTSFLTSPSGSRSIGSYWPLLTDYHKGWMEAQTPASLEEVRCIWKCIAYIVPRDLKCQMVIQNSRQVKTAHIVATSFVCRTSSLVASRWLAFQ